MKLAVLLTIALLPAALYAADNGVFASVYSKQDAALSADPNASFWKNTESIAITSDYLGEPMPQYRTEVRSRWTNSNLYLLFTCRYDQLSLKPNPDTKSETNQLWNYDVAEAFIGWDFAHINQYKEFEVSPRGEWVDLDIDRGNAKQAGWNWNSGFKVKTRVDEKAHLWYAEMMIPWSTLSPKAPADNTELRANFFLSVGPTDQKKNLAWRPPHKRTFHAPEAFGTLKLTKSPRQD